MSAKIVLVTFSIMFLFEFIVSPVQALTQDQFNNFKGKVDPAGSNCNNINALKDACNKAARKRTLIHENESLEFYSQQGCEYPRCEDVTFTVDDCANYGKTRVVNCCSKQSLYFSIGKGESEYGAYEFKCFQSNCTPKGNIGSVFV